MRAHVTLLASMFVFGCGVPASNAHDDLAAHPTAGAGEDLEVEVAAAPPEPTPLARALGALRPEVELVPDLHGSRADLRGVASVREGERVRALHRFSLGAARHARVGDTVFVDAAPAGTEQGVLFVWDLRADAVTRVAGLRRAEGLVGLGLGAVVSAEGEDLARHRYLLRPGQAPREAPDALSSVMEAAVLDGTTYLFRRQGDDLAISRLRSLDPVSEEAVGVVQGALWSDEATDTAWVVHLDGARLHLRRAPFAEERTVELGVRATAIESVSAGRVHLVAPRQRITVELATGSVERMATSRVSRIIEIEEAIGPRSLHELRLAGGGLFVRSRDAAFFLDAGGAHAIAPEAAPTAEAPSCACEDDALVCGAAHIEAACMALPALSTFRLEGESPPPSLPPPTQHAPDGRFRVDLIEADLARITRLADGARLWLRITTEMLVAQADDGAFWASEGALQPPHTVRWGHAILEAPVSALEADREALFQPALIQVFFAGEALPMARRPTH